MLELQNQGTSTRSGIYAGSPSYADAKIPALGRVRPRLQVTRLSEGSPAAGEVMSAIIGTQVTPSDCARWLGVAQVLPHRCVPAKS